MSNEYKEWLREQTFETLATDNYNAKLLLIAEQAKNKKLVEENNRAKEYAQKALKHVENDCGVAAKLVLRKIIKGQVLGQVFLDRGLDAK